MAYRTLLSLKLARSNSSTSIAYYHPHYVLVINIKKKARMYACLTPFLMKQEPGNWLSTRDSWLHLFLGRGCEKTRSGSVEHPFLSKFPHSAHKKIYDVKVVSIYDKQLIFITFLDRVNINRVYCKAYCSELKKQKIQNRAFCGKKNTTNIIRSLRIIFFCKSI